MDESRERHRPSRAHSFVVQELSLSTSTPQVDGSTAKRKPLFAVVSNAPTRDRHLKQQFPALLSHWLPSRKCRNQELCCSHLPGEIDVSAAVTQTHIGECTHSRPRGAMIVLPVVFSSRKPFFTNWKAGLRSSMANQLPQPVSRRVLMSHLTVVDQHEASERR